ncbi:helix-turn-helix domain-containing protein [uncultured Marinobacter sp.]|uniref:helix-turn-helix domain-containing protein n=1 Tax=uncultured Marinobacter sp. TaxID=187379 RepID=UPI002606389A|nr:helix-turn-helix domain-containing protein [uncultured Marinobacter sp.]
MKCSLTLRIRAVQRVVDGESPEVVIQALGMSRACIYEWRAAYRGGRGLCLNAIIFKVLRTGCNS